MDINISLVRRCKRQDKEAFNALLAQYEGILYKICFGYTRNKEEALDIMQEVYIKIFRSIQGFDESRPFLPWLKRIAVNTCINFQRDNLKHRGLSLDGTNDDELVILDTISAPTLVEDTVLSSESQRIINQTIRSMPDNYRIVLSLRYIEEMGYEEIALLTGQPLGTVKSNIFRGRDLLRKKLLQSKLLEVGQ